MVYLGSWITEDARSDEDIRARVGMAKAAFWQNKELMRRNIRLSTKMKILNCYVFSVLNYGCESWTWNKPMRMKVNVFERWCYRMILGISWRDHVSTPKVMERVQIELQTELHFTRDMIKRKMENGIRGTCTEGIEWFVTFTDTRGQSGGKKE